LPPGFFAEANVQFSIEIDVAAFEESGKNSNPSPTDGGWTPPPPMLTAPFTIITDVVEILVFAGEGGPTLAGAVELVSPSNKDRAAHRDAFVSKCAAYLQQGVGLCLVDVVRERRATLHDELMARLLVSGASLDTDLYAVAYRPVTRKGQPTLDVWRESLAVGQPLPTLPLWLRGGLCLPLDLGAAYERTCREQRVLVNGAG
jgi:hypothetical protein